MGRRLLAGLVVTGVLLAGAGCSDDGGDDAADTSTTEAAEEAEEAEETTTEAAEETTTEATDEETGTTVDELTIDDIRTYLEDEYPDEAALVDWDIIRWVSGFGYTATVPQGTGYGEAVAVCDALAEIVSQHAGDDIAVVAAPDEAPLASREGPDGTCAPAA